MVNCSHCGTELSRLVFCDASCKTMYHRKSRQPVNKILKRVQGDIVPKVLVEKKIVVKPDPKRVEANELKAVGPVNKDLMDTINKISKAPKVCPKHGTMLIGGSYTCGCIV